VKSNKRNNKKEYIKAILGEGTNFHGTLKYKGTVRIDGFFEGDIITEDILIVGENGVVKGIIEAGTVHVYGSIIGEIKANNKVEVKSTAQILGDISSPILTVEEGVRLLGNCNISQDITKERQNKLLPVNEPS